MGIALAVGTLYAVEAGLDDAAAICGRHGWNTSQVYNNITEPLCARYSPNRITATPTAQPTEPVELEAPDAADGSKTAARKLFNAEEAFAKEAKPENGVTDIVTLVDAWGNAIPVAPKEEAEPNGHGANALPDANEG